MNKFIKTDEDVVDFVTEFKTKQDFINWILKHPEKEYDPKTNTGWSIPRDNTAKMIYFNNGNCEPDPDTNIKMIILGPTDEITEIKLGSLEPNSKNDFECEEFNYQIKPDFVTTKLNLKEPGRSKSLVSRYISILDKSKTLFFGDSLRGYPENEKTLFLTSKERILKEFVGTVHIIENSRIKERIEMNAPASKTNYKLGKEWIENIYPLVSNYEKFKEFIKLNGWEYNEKTKTGWQETKWVGEFRYKKDGELVIDENLGVSKFQFNNRDKFTFAETNADLNEYPSNSTEIQPVCVCAEDNLGLKFRIIHCDMHYDLDSKDEYITISPPKKEEKVEEKKIHADNIASQKEYKLGTEFIDEVIPKISSLDGFLALIKERGEEYDEKTKTGWLEHMSSYEYFEKGASAVSSLGCNAVKFNSEKNYSV